VSPEYILRPKEDESVTFSIRVGRELIEKYNDLANRSGYSRNELIGMAMQHFIENVKYIPETGVKHAADAAEKYGDNNGDAK